MKNIFITGPPRVGKSTIITALAASSPLPKRGFITVETRHKGSRTGFEIHTLDGRRVRLSHVSIQSSRRVGKYGVDVEAFERLALPSLQASSPKDLIFIDEIGKMECFSDRFKQAVRAVLDGPQYRFGDGGYGWGGSRLSRRSGAGRISAFLK